MGPSPEAIKAEPERPSNETYAQKYWVRMDSLYFRIAEFAEHAFKVNKNINIIVVGVGIVLLAYAIIYSAFKGLDLYSTAFGTLGVLDFIAIFYFTPQKKIAKTVGDLTQSIMIYRTYWNQVETILDWIRDNRRGMSWSDTVSV